MAIDLRKTVLYYIIVLKGDISLKEKASNVHILHEDEYWMKIDNPEEYLWTDLNKFTAIGLFKNDELSTLIPIKSILYITKYNQAYDEDNQYYDTDGGEQ